MVDHSVTEYEMYEEWLNGEFDAGYTYADYLLDNWPAEYARQLEALVTKNVTESTRQVG